jgi:hypothetical protein
MESALFSIKRMGIYIPAEHEHSGREEWSLSNTKEETNDKEMLIVPSSSCNGRNDRPYCGPEGNI